jgi:hypothetical protein
MLQFRWARANFYGGMTRFLCIWLAVAALMQSAPAADQIMAQEAQKANLAPAIGTNEPPVPEIPQLSANPATESESQSRRMLPHAPATNALPSSVKRNFPQVQNVTFFIIGGMIAFLVIVAVTGRRPKG